ncbi:LysR family transcriptional regulator [Gracilibacillus alcaliphilus]|uniref:LysR family transcriptional regulator n=1 Tax=Gracilibacillus alcaliphilus TaxID=1401441 RepID=UPI00195AB496|nr:LysR family transcriptional regulator [Gracilibacillus alcaliphilus]MBM7679228.1 DNA-binding transcriptional LysR family regulator [Gracilibacillus alcaliphilus]
MNLQQLKVFVYTVKYKKLYLVAKKLGIRQPTVTFHLNKLQEELGIPLFFTKSYHTIQLTEAGNSLYHYAQSITSQSEEIEDLMQEFKELKAGCISIGSTHTPATYIIIPYLSKLKKEYNDISIVLDVNTSSVIIEKVKQFQLDFGIITEVNLKDEELIITPWRKDDLVIVMHPDHPLTKKQTLTPSDLSGQPLVHHESESVSRKLFDQWANQHGVSLKIKMETSGSEAMKEAVKHEMGYGILSENIISREVRSGELCMQPIPEWKYKRQIFLIRRKDKLVSPAMQLFLDRFRLE